MKRRSNSRDLILDATEALALDAGASRVTLDAVAERAGVSKGGLLYNFPSKGALLEGLIARLCERFDQAKEAARASSGGGRAAGLKAYVATALATEGSNNTAAGALLAAIANDPKLLRPVREHHRRYVEELAASELPFAQAAVVWLATEGLWLYELLKLSPLVSSQRRQVVKELLRLADGAAGSGGRSAASRGSPPARTRPPSRRHADRRAR